MIAAHHPRRMLRQLLVMLAALALAGTSAVATAAPPVRDTLSGTVTFPDGSPAPATLQFSQWNPASETWSYGGSAETDALGRYSFDTATDGQYAIIVYAAPAGIATSVWLVEGGTDHYAHSKDRAGLFASDATVDLRLVAYERISGVATGADGAPASKTSIDAYWYDPGSGTLVDTRPMVAFPADMSGRKANPDGEYWVGNLLPGETYVVRFGAFSPYVAGTYSSETPSGFTSDSALATPVEAGSRLDVTLPLEGTLSGTVRMSSGEPAKSFPIYRVVDTPTGPSRTALVHTDSGGRFTVGGLLDHEDFALEVVLRQGVGFWNEPGYVTVSDDAVQLTPVYEEAKRWRSSSHVDISLVDTPSRAGRLVATDGRPLRNLRVQAREYVDGQLGWVVWYGWTDPEGRFTAMNLGGPSRYVLHVSNISTQISPYPGYLRQCGSRFMLAYDASMGTPLTPGAPLGTLTATSDCDAPDPTPEAPPTTPEPELPALVSVSRPQVRSEPQVDENLLVSLGTWRPTATEFRVQWLRDGKPIPGADLPLYVPTLADVGHRLQARVEASGSGVRSTSALSDKTRKVPKSRAHITLKAPKKVRADKRPNVTVRIAAPGVSRLTGKVTLKYGTWVKQVKVTRARKGVVKVRLPKSAVGKKKLIATFAPDKTLSRTVTKDKSPKKTIRVVHR